MAQTILDYKQAETMKTENRIRLMICDDHPIVREGLVAVLSQEPDMEVIAQASNGKEAIELYRIHKPDVTLLDFVMPEMNGLQALIAIRTEFPNAKVAMFTNRDGDEDVFRSLQAGAAGYMLKDAPRADLIKTIHFAHRGQTNLSAEVAALLASRVTMRTLTSRDLDVMELIANGKSNLDIGEALFITEGTVKAHVNSILSKLGVTDRTQAVVKALSRGIVHIGTPTGIM